MGNHVITKGLDLPITGEPKQEITRVVKSSHVAVVGHDYPFMKPRMHVAVGDKVKRGTLLFEDRKAEGVGFTAPGAGEIVAIHRGEKRAFQSLVIKLTETEQAGTPSGDDLASFSTFSGKAISELTGDDVRGLMAESGLWTALRSRPHSRVPGAGDVCSALFVTATDSNPLAPSVPVTIAGQDADFKAGLAALAKLTDGPVFLCVGKDWTMDVSDVAGVQVETFSGKHPSGLAGTHIHTLFPVSRARVAWHIGAQDVVAAGTLFKKGEINVRRVVSVAGPNVTSPSLVETRLGAETAALTEGCLPEGKEFRTISGSALYGHKAQGEVHGYLNRYDQQITALEEDRERHFLGWLSPGVERFSTVRAIVAGWIPGKKFGFTTTTHGSHRAMVPIGMFERVMPLDVMPTFLLRAILMGDLESAEQLGCLELHEEDLALCNFVSPGKEDYGVALRKVLAEIWQEG
jgi:Na+-transporting NADH:ubiquinone oxidoreductase subunit A